MSDSCNPMDWGIPGFLVLHYLLEFAQTMYIKSMMPSNRLILCCPLLLLPSVFPSIRVFPMSRLFASGGLSIGVSVSVSVLPVNIQGWFPLGLVSLLSKGLSRVFSSITVWKHLHLESLSTPTPIESSLFYPFIDN